MPGHRLILASQSPRRRELLAKLGYPFDVVVADVEEITASPKGPRDVALTNALLKARTVADELGGGAPANSEPTVVIGADTVVTIGGALLGKPRNADEAAQMLQRLQGKTHQVITGVALISLKPDPNDHGRSEHAFADVTEVTFHRLSRMQILGYLSKIHPMDKAGGYAIQEHGDQIVAEIRGSYSNVVGLPTEALQQTLRQILQPEG